MKINPPMSTGRCAWGKTVRQLTGALALILTGCAATEAEKAAADKAIQDWQVCVLRAVAQLDDGRSDPVSIAFAIEPACAGLYEEVIQTSNKGVAITEAGQSYGSRLMKDGELKLITGAILTYRASQARK